MLFGTPLGAAFTCASGVCYGSPNFLTFQREVNRLRAKVGLAPDVPVDGRIGAVTIAKFAALAKRLKNLLGNLLAEELDDYTSTDIVVGMTANVLANEIPVLIHVLQANGVTSRCDLEGANCNLPLWAQPTAPPPPKPPFVATLPVGPTAPPLTPAFPVAPVSTTKNLAIAGAVVGILAISALAAVAVIRR